MARPLQRGMSSPLSSGSMNGYGTLSDSPVSKPSFFKLEMASAASFPLVSAAPPLPRRGWVALQCIMVCFASLFVLIGVLGLSSESYASHALPGLQLHRAYRRIQLEINSAEFTERGVFGRGSGRSKELEECPQDLEHFTPCYNVSANLHAASKDREEHDRHCDSYRKDVQCYIRAPKEYKIPPRWPMCRDRVWLSNLLATREDLLEIEAKSKRLMVLDDSLVLFHSENDDQIADGSENYAHQISTMIGVENDSLFNKAGVRTVLDIGCGYGSFGAHLLSRNVLSLCLAPYERKSSHVQFALERGLPAMIGSLLSKQLPYSAAAFDMVHCADCEVDWRGKGGIYLMEVDRLLRPGGYFVWTSSLTRSGKRISSDKEHKMWNGMEGLVRRMCWELLSQQEQTFIWKKKTDRSCYLSRNLNATPSICDGKINRDFGLYRSLPQCIDRAFLDNWASNKQGKFSSDYIALPSGSLPIKGYFNEELASDLTTWSATVKNYWSLFTPLIFSDHPKRPGEDDPVPPLNIVRNVMDMNAAFGGFNAGLLQAGKHVWVMNVVPTSGLNTLPVIYNRGLVGALHDWCEAFPTHPRTYDLLHAIGLLSQELERSNSCGLSRILLEMDRILRPEGWVLLRDKAELIEVARVAALQMRWETRVVEVEGDGELRLLVSQKNFLKN